MAKQKTFMVMAKCYRNVSIEISATSLEDALTKSKGLKDENFVEVLGEYNDGSTEVYGVFES